MMVALIVIVIVIVIVIIIVWPAPLRTAMILVSLIKRDAPIPFKGTYRGEGPPKNCPENKTVAWDIEGVVRGPLNHPDVTIIKVAADVIIEAILRDQLSLEKKILEAMVVNHIINIINHHNSNNHHYNYNNHKRIKLNSK